MPGPDRSRPRRQDNNAPDPTRAAADFPSLSRQYSRSTAPVSQWLEKLGQPVASPSSDITRPGGSALLPKLIAITVVSLVMATIQELKAYAPWFFFIAFAVVVVIESVRVVPQQQAWVIERLGRFHAILEPGLRVIVPFVDRVQYRHSLKEVPLDVPEQVCITRDNTQLSVDGIIYYQVTDPRLASYGSSDYIMAITQLAQTTLRSEIGKMELDRTFESRDEINRQIVSVLDEAGRTWGVKVLRYEIKNLTPPETILRAMQAQITAEREKRALIAKSEGQKQEEINLAEGAKQAAILRSEGERAAQINKAQGEAQAIVAVADATAQATRAVAEAIGTANGMDAANLKVAELYVQAFGNLAREGNTLIVPANLADISSLVGSAMTVLDGVRKVRDTTAPASGASTPGV
jgi:regulator of protease activity HflC (stomatin/prohibitin superfamily)